MAEKIDVAIRIGELPDSELVATRIGETRLMLCATPAYLADRGTPVHPDELVRHSLIGFNLPGAGTRFRYRFRVDGEVRQLTFPTQLTVDSGDALIAAALQSVGLIMISDHAIADLLEDGRLVQVLAEYEALPLPVSVIYAPSGHLSVAARALIDMLRTINASDRVR